MEKADNNTSQFMGGGGVSLNIVLLSDDSSSFVSGYRNFFIGFRVS